MSRFARWLDSRSIPVRCLEEGLVATFLTDSSVAHHSRKGYKATMEALMRHLRDVGAVTTRVAHDDSRGLSVVESDYERHLARERGLSAETVRFHLYHAHRFVTESFGPKAARFSGLRQQHITQYILRHASAYKQRSAQTWISALRGFIRYLYLRGETDTDLSGCVMKTANWNLSTLPKYIEASKVEQLLRAVDRKTRAGLRNYAILLLLARLGLRAGEIIHMELEDLHWEAGELTVRGKNSRWSQLPIPPDVGAAIVAYLRRGRPRCATRRLFVRMKAPHGALDSSSTITSMVASCLDRAGIKAARKGAHALRHSLATRMLRQGSSLEEICQVLRHLHLNTTEIYAKVDLHALRLLAQTWPGARS